MSQKILILEDEPEMQPLLANYVEEAGYEAIIGNHDQEGLALLEQHGTFACILLDYNMPVMDGLRFLNKKQTLDAYKDIPVLMCTSCSSESPEFAQPIAKGWIKGFLEKPFNLAQLEAGLALI